MRKFIRLVIASISLTLMVGTFAWAKEWDPRLLQASRQTYAGQVQEAEATINEYIQAQPYDPNGLLVKGIVLDWKATLTGQDYNASQAAILELYKTANNLAFHLWEDDPKNVDRLIDIGNSYLFLGRKYSDRGDWFKAVLTSKKCQKHLEAAQEIDPTRVDGLLALGGFHYLADNTPKSAAVFKKLLGIRGTKAQGLAELNKSLTQQHPYYYDTRYALMFIYKDFEKNYPEALNQLAALEKEFPQNPEFRYRRAMIYEAQDKAKSIPSYLELAEWCKNAGNACHPNYQFLAYYRAGKNAAELGNNAQAEEWLGIAQQKDLGLDAETTARTWQLLAEIDLKEKKASLAIDKLQKAKETPKLSKDFKKELENSIKQICEAEKISEKC